MREPLEVQRAQYAELEPAQQLHLYLAARAAERPDEHLCEQLGKSAEKVTPEILKALLDEKQDREKRSLLRALVCARSKDSCDPRLAPIGLTVAKSIVDKDERTEASKQANSLRCASR